MMYMLGDKSKGATCLAAICAGILGDEGDELYCELVHDGGEDQRECCEAGRERCERGQGVYIRARA